VATSYNKRPPKRALCYSVDGANRLVVNSGVDQEQNVRFPDALADLHKCWPPHTQFDISPDMNRSIFYIIGVIVVIVIVLKLLGLF
jgi:hypothetical protein